MAADFIDGDWDEPRGYDTAIVCENGHKINDHVQSHPEYNAPYCPKCGAKGVSKCKCGQPIRGGLFNVGGSYDPPAHCHGCGSPHVWTLRKKEALESLIEELDGLDNDEKQKLVKSVPDLIVESPMSQTAVVRVKKSIDRLKPEARKNFYDLLKQIASAAVLKMLGL